MNTRFISSFSQAFHFTPRLALASNQNFFQQKFNCQIAKIRNFKMKMKTFFFRSNIIDIDIYIYTQGDHSLFPTSTE